MQYSWIMVLLSLLARPVCAKQFVYVSLDGENRIAVFELEQDGQLRKRLDVETASPPGALCSSPDGEYLYASLRQAGKLASFRIDGRTGNLAHINTVDAGADPAFVATDQTGNFLFSAYYIAGKVCVHSISQGRLSTAPSQTISTVKNAHAILPDRKNKFVFVPHTGPNAIYQFHFNAKQGRLAPDRQSPLKTGEQTGPRQLAFHPTLDVVYFDYEQGSAIAAFDFNRTTGKLTFREQLSSLSKDYSGKNSNARIEMTPDGRFIYVANRGHDSLAGYAIDPSTGGLTPLGQFATEATPRGFAIDKTSQFLIAAGQASNKLASYRIDPSSGKLSRLGTYEVGLRPWWVLISNAMPFK